MEGKKYYPPTTVHAPIFLKHMPHRTLSCKFAKNDKKSFIEHAFRYIFLRYLPTMEAQVNTTYQFLALSKFSFFRGMLRM